MINNSSKFKQVMASPPEYKEAIRLQYTDHICAITGEDKVSLPINLVAALLGGVRSFDEIKSDIKLAVELSTNHDDLQRIMEVDLPKVLLMREITILLNNRP